MNFAGMDCGIRAVEGLGEYQVYQGYFSAIEEHMEVHCVHICGHCIPQGRL